MFMTHLTKVGIFSDDWHSAIVVIFHKKDNNRQPEIVINVCSKNMVLYGVLGRSHTHAGIHSNLMQSPVSFSSMCLQNMTSNGEISFGDFEYAIRWLCHTSRQYGDQWLLHHTSVCIFIYSLCTI